MAQATALLVYGLARSRGQDPASVTAAEVRAWITDHQLPPPPQRPGAGLDSTLAAVHQQVQLWRHAVDIAPIGRCGTWASCYGRPAIPCRTRVGGAWTGTVPTRSSWCG